MWNKWNNEWNTEIWHNLTVNRLHELPNWDNYGMHKRVLFTQSKFLHPTKTHSAPTVKLKSWTVSSIPTHTPQKTKSILIINTNTSNTYADLPVIITISGALNSIGLHTKCIVLSIFPQNWNKPLSLSHTHTHTHTQDMVMTVLI